MTLQAGQSAASQPNADTAAVSIRHEPEGSGDPYNPGPTARMPFQPEAGLPCKVLAVVSPPAGAERVWVTWTVPEGSAPSEEGYAEAEHLLDSEEGTHWSGTLPPFDRACRVEYRLHTFSAGQESVTDPYSVAIGEWQAAGDVVGVEHARDRLLLSFAHGDGFVAHVELTVQSPGAIALSVGPGPMPGQPKNVEQVSQVLSIQEQSDEHLLLGAGDAQVWIGLKPFGIKVTRGNTPVLSIAEGGLQLLVTPEGAVKVAARFFSPPDEAFIGFGERFNSLNQRGNTLDVQVYEQYKAQGKRTYMPVPFFVSSHGYGIYLDTTRPVTYDLAASDPQHWSLTCDTGYSGDRNDPSNLRDHTRVRTPPHYLRLHLFLGEPKEVLTAFTDLTGKPVMPPEWAFGPWMSGNEWNSQAAVMEQVRLTLEHDIPATVLVIEAWSDETTFYIWNEAQYEPNPPEQPFRYTDFTFPPEGKWPDPKRMVDDLHTEGIRLLLWQVPVMKKLEGSHPQQDRDEAYMKEHGYCVRDADGQPYHVKPLWFRGGMVPDFTNADAVQWWLSKRAYLLDEIGIDGFKTDGGEHLWGRDLRFSDGRSGAEVINEFPALYTGAYYRFANEKRGGDAVTFSRAGFTGSQASPCHWAGDEDSTWEAFRASILAGLSAGASGIPFWGWDIGGFSGEIPSAELYLRATAMSCFCPIMQYHSEFNDHRTPSRDRTPWNIGERTGDPDVVPVFRRYAKLRMRMLPYLYAEAQKSSQTGIPMMRSLLIEYPHDPAVRDYPYQYHMGDSLLVAPVVEEGASRQTVYLPAGEWVDFWTGDTYQGPCKVDYGVPKDMIPVFARPGTVTKGDGLSQVL